MDLLNTFDKFLKQVTRKYLQKCLNEYHHDAFNGLNFSTFGPILIFLSQLLQWRHSLCTTLGPRQNVRHFPDDILKYILMNEKARISIKMSLKFGPNGTINDILALVQFEARRRPGYKPLSEPMMVSLLTHLCVTRSQWAKNFMLSLSTNRSNKNEQTWSPTIKICKPTLRLFAVLVVPIISLKDHNKSLRFSIARNISATRLSNEIRSMLITQWSGVAALTGYKIPWGCESTMLYLVRTCEVIVLFIFSSTTWLQMDA